MKGICFIEPMFHKVVKGEKTQTRRLLQSPTGFFNVESSKNGVIQSIWRCDADGCSGGNLISVNPKYRLGEIVYLKEPYVLYDEQYQERRTNASGIQFAYRYGNNIPIAEITGKSDSKWKNKLFMPKSAARYFIKITAIRAERLQDISNIDCRKEGVEICLQCKGICTMNEVCAYPIAEYSNLINRINGKGTWEKNPWVWVYDFKLYQN